VGGCPGEVGVTDVPAGLSQLEAAHAIRPRRARTGTPQRVPAWWYLAGALVVAGSWWFVLSQGRVVPPDVLQRAAEFLAELLGAGAARPTSGADVRALELAVETLAMSVLAAGLAGVAALTTIGFAARNLTTGASAAVPTAVGRAVLTATRGVHIIARAVPDVVWALLIVFVLRPGIVAGALALALHNFGVMGRLGSDVVEDLAPGPLAALRSNGAGNLQLLSYGVLPQVLPQFVTFLLYRWEVIIRASAIVGFVAQAGLGYELRLALSRFAYTEVALILAVYVVLVWGVDLASGALRRLAG
jgi:phosphonate transport system permease protein